MLIQPRMGRQSHLVRHQYRVRQNYMIKSACVLAASNGEEGSSSKSASYDEQPHMLRHPRMGGQHHRVR